jgi:hypothetical protein
MPWDFIRAISCSRRKTSARKRAISPERTSIPLMAMNMAKANSPDVAAPAAA